MIRNICTSTSSQFDWGINTDVNTFDEAKYKQLCKESNLQP